jgi:predicted phage-related endonuclease
VVESERMRLGRLLEPAILARYAEDTTLRVAPNDQLHRAAAHPWLAATPDAFVFDATGKLAGLAQAKATSSVAGWHDGQPPLYYQVQAAVEMVVADAPWDDFPTLIAGSDYTCPRVERHVAAEEAIIDALAEFWQRFVSPATPPPHISEGDMKTYLAMVPARARSIISLPPAAVSLWEQMRTNDAQAKIYDGRAKEAKAALLGLQGDAEVGMVAVGCGDHSGVQTGSHEVAGRGEGRGAIEAGDPVSGRGIRVEHRRQIEIAHVRQDARMVAAHDADAGDADLQCGERLGHATIPSGSRRRPR